MWHGNGEVGGCFYKQSSFLRTCSCGWCAYSFVVLRVVSTRLILSLELSVDLPPFFLRCGWRYSAMSNALTNLIASLSSLVQDGQATSLSSLFEGLGCAASKLRRPTSPSLSAMMAVNLRHSLSPQSRKLRHRPLKVSIGGFSR